MSGQSFQKKQVRKASRVDLLWRKFLLDTTSCPEDRPVYQGKDKGRGEMVSSMTHAQWVDLGLGGRGVGQTPQEVGWGGGVCLFHHYRLHPPL